MNQRERQHAEVAIAAGVFLISLAAYLLTLTPSLSYNSIDGNEMATVPSQLGLLHPTGYPVYTWMGKAFSYLPFGDVAYRANLLSAVCGAGTAGLVTIIVVLLGRGSDPVGTAPSRQRSWPLFLAAVFGALLLAFSVTFWSQAVIAEVYTPNTLLLALSLLLLLLWGRHEESAGGRDGTDPTSVRLFGSFALVYGLSMGTHLSNLAFAPGFVFYILLTNRYFLLQPTLVASALMGFAVGLLQFAWLPLKVGDPNSAVTSVQPDDLRGIYDYTVGAFPQFRWAYPLSEVPDRIVVYVDIVLANFYVPGALLALIGAWAMLWRHPKAFFLFLGAYVSQVVFFSQYNVVDLEVFFLPSHLIVAIVAAYGLWSVTELTLMHHIGRFPLPVNGKGVRRRGSLALLIVLLALPAYSLLDRWDENDESRNTGINDFYKLVFQRLPQGAVLTGGSGVTSYDLFYYPITTNPRPDLTIPTLPGRARDRAQPDTGGPQYAVTSGFLGRTPSFSGADRSLWQVPVLASPTVPFDPKGGRRLTLYRGQTEPPQLFVAGAAPSVRVDRPVGDLTLVGYDIDSQRVVAGETVHLRLYWMGPFNNLYSVSTQVGEAPYFENHDLGFGNFNRYVTTVRRPNAEDALVEEYDLVVLSSLDAGQHRLRVRTIAAAGGASEWLDIGTIMVEK